MDLRYTKKERFILLYIYNSIVELNFEESPKRKKEIGRLFGDKAKQLKDGDMLKVVMDSVEGRDVAILVKLND